MSERYGRSELSAAMEVLFATWLKQELSEAFFSPIIRYDRKASPAAECSIDPVTGSIAPCPMAGSGWGHVLPTAAEPLAPVASLAPVAEHDAIMLLIKTYQRKGNMQDTYAELKKQGYTIAKES